MFRLSIGLCVAVAAAAPAMAKPIAFADGTTVMAEYGAGTMQLVREHGLWKIENFD